MSNFQAQCEEDVWLDRHWKELGLPDVGFFVEFGAGDGVTFSNTYWLEKNRWWKGLLCEPDPRHVIRDRPGCIVERCFVGRPGEVEFQLHPTDPFLSGTTRPSAETRTIPSVPLSELLQRHRVERVDFISLDTEGTELDAWASLDLERWRPRIAIFEFVTWEVSNYEKEITAQLEADGYELIKKTWLNGIFRDTK